MAKMDWLKFGKAAVERAGDIYISEQEIKAMKQKQKEKEKEFELAKRQAEAGMESQATEDAAKLFGIMHPESRVHKQQIEYLTDKVVKVEQKIDVTGGKGDAGARGSASSLRADLGRIEDDKARIVADIGGIKIGEIKQRLSDATAEMEAALVRGDYDTQTYRDIFNRASADIDEIALKTGDDQVFVRTAKNALGRYHDLVINRQIPTGQDLGIYTTATPSATPEVEIPSDEKDDLDDIINAIK